jgi:hypothetical protein
LIHEWRKILEEKKAEDGETRWRETNKSSV